MADNKGVPVCPGLMEKKYAERFVAASGEKAELDTKAYRLLKELVDYAGIDEVATLLDTDRVLEIHRILPGDAWPRSLHRHRDHPGRMLPTHGTRRASAGRFYIALGPGDAGDLRAT